MNPAVYHTKGISRYSKEINLYLTHSAYSLYPSSEDFKLALLRLTTSGHFRGFPAISRGGGK